MAREPYRGVDLTEAYRPVAAPVDSFVQAQVPSRDNSLQDLARSLSTLGGSLGELVGKRDREAEENDRLQGEAAFHASKRQGFAEAVATGVVPPQYSQSFMQGYKQAQGEVAGAELAQKYAAAYDAWDQKTNADPKAYDAFTASFIADNIQTQDKDVLRGLMPKVRQISENYLQRHIGDVSRATMQGALETEAARNDQLIKAASSAGLGAEKGMDYAGTFGTIETNRAAALSRGVNKDKYDQQVVDGITSAAIELGDRKILDFLDRKVPGADFTWSNTPYGQEAKRKAADTIDKAGRQAVADAEEKRKELKRAEKDAITTATVLAISKNPDAPLPEALLARGEKVDPTFRVDVLNWRDKFGRAAQTSDPDEMKAVYADILGGAGLPRVMRGIKEGTFKNPEDLVKAANFAKARQEHGPKLTAILGSEQSKAIERSIRERTLAQNDATRVLDPDGMTDVGLAARQDYRIALFTWSQKHPDADFIEQEEAIGRIGAGILGRLGKDDNGDRAYSREGLTRENPFPTRMPAEAPASNTVPKPTPKPAAGNPFAGTTVRVPSGLPGAPDEDPAPMAGPAAAAPQPVPVTPTASGTSPVAAPVPSPVPAPAAPTAAAPPQPAAPTAPPVAPAAPPTAAPVAAQPSAPPAPARRALPVANPNEPAPLNAQDWFAKEPPETRAVLEKMATKQGQPLEALVARAYQTGIAKGSIKPPPAAGSGAPATATPATPAAPGKRTEAPRAPDGTPIETASTSAATNPREEIVQSFRQAAEGAYVGRATFDGTKATLNGQTFTGPASPEQVARKFEGLSEADPQHRAVLTDFLSKAAGQRIDPAKVPWCAAFVDAVLDASGKPKRGSLRAADFLDYGSATDKPTKGDVVVFRSMARGSSGHVGFVVGIEGDRVRYIAGNDDNRVQEDTLPLARVAGFRRPPEAGAGPFGADAGQAAGAFSRVLGTTGQPTGGYALPELKADPKAARILDLVTGAELKSGDPGNYNAIFGNAGATEDLSKRTLDQTIAWSRDRGTSSSATGRYQFMADTMAGLKQEMGLTGAEPFTPELQDRMALRLLARRGFREWATGKLSNDDFANNLAKEWAALPNLQTGRSHYAGDGVNKALVSPEQVRSVLEGTGAFPAARLASVAKTLTAPVAGSRLLSRVRGMFGGGSVAETTSVPAPEPAPVTSRPAPLPAAVQASHAHVLAGLEPEVASVVRRAQADNPNLRLVAWAGRGGRVEVRAVGPDGRPIPTGDGDDLVGEALQRAAGQIGVGVNWASGTRTLSSVKKTLKA